MYTYVDWIVYIHISRSFLFITPDLSQSYSLIFMVQNDWNVYAELARLLKTRLYMYLFFVIDYCLQNTATYYLLSYLKVLHS